MEGYEVKFRVFANSQEEADRAGKAAGAFVNRLAARGIPVTAARLAEAVERAARQRWDTAAVRANALAFGPARFLSGLAESIRQTLG